MPKRKTAEASVETASAAPEQKKRSVRSTSSAKSTAAASTHKRAAKRAEQPAAAEPLSIQTSVQPAIQAVSAPTHEEIATRAYFYFAERGFRHGEHLTDWLRAERELTARNS